MKKESIRLSLLAFLAIMSMCIFVACGDDDDDDAHGIPAGLVGTWGGDVTNGRTGTTRTLIVTFKANGTGDLTFESSVYYRVANFNYTVSGSTVSCKGVMAGEDGNIDYDWSQSFTYHGTYLQPEGAYSDILLYKEGSSPEPGENSGNGSQENTEPTVSYGFDYRGADYDTASDTYTHLLYMGYGVSAGNYSLGVTRFGLAVRAVDGTLPYKTSSNSSGGVTSIVANGHNMTYFYKNLPDDDAHEWGDFIIVKSRNKTITLEYMPRYYNGNYVDFAVQTKTYTATN